MRAIHWLIFFVMGIAYAQADAQAAVALKQPFSKADELANPLPLADEAGELGRGTQLTWLAPRKGETVRAFSSKETTMSATLHKGFEAEVSFSNDGKSVRQYY